MSSVLPFELDEYILFLLFQNKCIGSLRSCSLVSRSFQRICQPLLFNRITLNRPRRLSSRRSHPSQSFSKLLESSPHLAEYVCHLQISDSDSMRFYSGSKSWIREDPYLPSILPRLSHLQTLDITGRVTSWLDWSAWSLQFQDAISSVLQQGSITGIKLFAVRNVPADIFSKCRTLDSLYLEFVRLKWTQGQTKVIPRRGFFSDLTMYAQEWRLLREEFGEVQVGRYRTHFNLKPSVASSLDEISNEALEALKRYMSRVQWLSLVFPAVWPSDDPDFADSQPLVGLLGSASNLIRFDASSQINHNDTVGRTLTLLAALNAIVDRLPSSVTRLDLTFPYLLPTLDRISPLLADDIREAWVAFADRLRRKSCERCHVQVCFDIRFYEGVPVMKEERVRAMEAANEVRGAFSVLEKQPGVGVEWEYSPKRILLY